MKARTRVLAATLIAAAAASGETNDVTVLAPIVVYGSRIDDRVERMASSVKAFDAEAVAASGARSLPELLDKSVNLHIRTMNANPLQSEVAMRGFGAGSSGRVKIVVDGEDLSPVDMEPPELTRVPADGIERLEVILGPSPVLHGDGAVAGVVNVTTDSQDASARSRLAVRGGSFGTVGLGASTRGGIATNGVRYSASYDYSRSDDYRRRSGYDLHSFRAALRQDFKNGSRVGLGANYANALYQLPGALTYEQWKQDPRQARYDDDWCRRWNYGFGLDAKAKLAEDQWLHADAGFTVRHRKSHWGDFGYANEYDLYGYRLSPRYVNEKDVFGLPSKATAGFDFACDRYEVTDRSGYGSPDPRFYRDRYGLYAHEELSPAETLSLVFGARGELVGNRWANCGGLQETSSRDLAADFELGLVYRPLDGLKAFVKGSRFHRSASCDELNYTRDGRFLEPETGASLDLGLDWRIDREFRFDLDGYWTVIEDEIFYDPHAQEYGGRWGGYNCNSPGRTERLGFDVGFGWKRDETAEASVRYAFVQSRFADGDYAGKSVPIVPQSRVRAEVGVWLLPDLEIKGGFRYVSPQFLSGDFDNAHERLAGYSLFDLGADYEPEWAEGWKVALTVDNLLDRSYCDFAGWADGSGAYYYPACGRSFFVSLSYEF